MKKFNDAIVRFVNPVQPLGAKATGDGREEKLIRDLEFICSRNRKLAWILVVVLLIMFGCCVGVVLFKDLKTAKGMLGLFGMSAAGCISWLYRIWSEMTATEQLLRLAVDMKGQALTQIVNVLAKKALKVK
jgi:hypothetical protein